jgi:protein TonB
MEPLSILYADNLDLLFENRNKLYGAYPLRKYYAQRLYAAMGTVLGLVLIFSCAVIFFRAGAISGHGQPIPDIVLTQVILQPPLVPEPVAARSSAPAKPVATAALSTPLIVRELPVPKPMPTVEELNLASIGIHTTAGPADEGAEGQPVSPGSTGIQKPDSVAEAPAIFDNPEHMPEFPGGPEALKRYLMRNLHMPDSGLEPGSQVRVIARFVVGPDGRVHDIQLMQPGGKIFDEEVVKVISRMPAWKPGIQHQKKVSVYYQLPVNFVVPLEN